MKPPKLIISKQAIEDLTDIWSYIALDNYDAADEFTDKLYASCKNLSKMPEMGRSRDELLPGLRSLTYKGYIIFYRSGKQKLEIIRVLNGCMDVDSIF
ncbi:MAG: type II toxin-antitoxin system RelE/ParE family toxin [Victivallales bacterium]|jgi:toxin ParE1/3/4